MGDSSKNEDLRSLLQEAQAANDARIAEVERRLGSQMQQLSLQMQELLSGINRGTSNDFDGTASSNIQPPARGVQSGSGMVPRYTKLDFPTFDGSEDPLIWLHRCEKFFSNQHTQEADKVGVAAFHMLGEAQLWYHQLEIENPSINWIGFKKYCTLRFGPPAHSNPLGELVNLNQVGSVEEYQRQFQERLARASKFVRADQYVSLFTAGLTDSIRLEVELHNPPDLAHAMNLARAFERKQIVLREATTQRGTWQGSKSDYSSNIAAPTSQLSRGSTTLGGPTETKSANPSTAFIKKLSRAEMADRRAKGLCYNCDDPYTVGHQCKKLFWLEVEDPIDAESATEVEPEPAISLHAIMGQKNARTMQVMAVMQEQPLLGLVDSGSTHNFISLTAAQRLQIKAQPQSSASVSVANGDKVRSTGFCPAVSFSIDGNVFTADFVIIPLAGFDMVLGIKWLQTLGPILWDFASLTMSFAAHGNQIVLQGRRTSPTNQLLGLYYVLASIVALGKFWFNGLVWMLQRLLGRLWITFGRLIQNLSLRTSSFFRGRVMLWTLLWDASIIDALIDVQH